MSIFLNLIAQRLGMWDQLVVVQQRRVSQSVIRWSTSLALMFCRLCFTQIIQGEEVQVDCQMDGKYANFEPPPHI